MFIPHQEAALLPKRSPSGLATASGPSSIPCARKMFPTVVSEGVVPRFFSAPSICLYFPSPFAQSGRRFPPWGVGGQPYLVGGCSPTSSPPMPTWGWKKAGRAPTWNLVTAITLSEHFGLFNGLVFQLEVADDNADLVISLYIVPGIGEENEVDSVIYRCVRVSQRAYFGWIRNTHSGTTLLVD